MILQIWKCPNCFRQQTKQFLKSPNIPEITQWLKKIHCICGYNSPSLEANILSKAEKRKFWHDESVKFGKGRKKTLEKIGF